MSFKDKSVYSLLNWKDRPGRVLWFRAGHRKLILPLEDDEVFRIKLKFENWDLFVFDLSEDRIKPNYVVAECMFFNDKLVIDGIEFFLL